MFDASAIAALVRSYGLNGRLNSVLIIGDDTIDYHSYYGLTLPRGSFPVWMGRRSRARAFGESHRRPRRTWPSAMTVPVQQTDPEADAVVAKIQRQQGAIAANADRHLLVVDNQTIGDPSFRKAADTTASGLPRNTREGLRRRQPRTGPRPADPVRRPGRRRFVRYRYFGHGGPQIWADEELLPGRTTSSLAGTRRWSRSCGPASREYYPSSGPSAGRRCCSSPGGSVPPSFGPAGITDFRAQELFYRVLYSELLDPKVSFGEAIRRAKARSVADHPELRPVIEGFNLLGDPTIRLGGLKPRWTAY